MNYGTDESLAADRINKLNAKKKNSKKTVVSSAEEESTQNTKILESEVADNDAIPLKQLALSKAQSEYKVNLSAGITT